MSLSRESNFLELIQHGNPEALTLLTNSPELFETGLPFTFGGPQPLFHLAAYFKQPALLQDMFKLADTLIAAGKLERSIVVAHMQISDHQGRGILHLVAEMGSKEVFDSCLRYGASLTGENTLHQTVAECAAANSRLDILNHLIKLKIPAPPQDLDEVEAAELTAELPVLERLYDINAPSSIQNTPLHHYHEVGMNDDTAEFLLINGANIHALNQKNKSPLKLILMGASDSGFFLTASQIHKATFLLERGAKLNDFSLDELENIDHTLKSQFKTVSRPSAVKKHKGDAQKNIYLPGDEIEFKDLQYLRAIIAEKTKDFDEAKWLYSEAAVNGSVGAAIRLSSYYELKEDWENALKWYMSALNTFSHEVSFDRAVYLAAEYLEQGGSIDEGFYRDFAHAILDKQEVYYVSAETHLKLAHWISRLHEDIDGISSDQRIKVALGHAASGYRQAFRERSIEIIEEAEEDINHFMTLRLQHATPSEKNYYKRLNVPEHHDVNHYYQLSLQLANLNLEELNHDFRRALEWYQIANALAGKNVPDPANAVALRKAIKSMLKSEKAAGASLHGYSIFIQVGGLVVEGPEIFVSKRPKKGTRNHDS
ncbi:MAG: hypothetical protein P4M14_06355 [Gammaproteobacteria bacterium]|nr:hypothetical protein [Gammaproteobacteria bacterium]